MIVDPIKLAIFGDTGMELRLAECQEYGGNRFFEVQATRRDDNAKQDGVAGIIIATIHCNTLQQAQSAFYALSAVAELPRTLKNEEKQVKEVAQTPEQPVKRRPGRPKKVSV